VVGAAVALEEAMVCLPFGAISTARILKTMEEKLEAFLGSIKA